MEKAVLSLDELVEYTGWGKTKLRALLIAILQSIMAIDCMSINSSLMNT